MTIVLTDLAPSARWTTGTLVGAHNTTDNQTIPFAGSDGDSRGFARVDLVKLEGGGQLEVLRTHPKWTQNGTIKGHFPWFTCPANAVFETGIGFVEGARRTNGVFFQVWVHYIDGGRQRWHRIGRQEKGFTGSLMGIRADLSRFEGQQIQIELRCDAMGSSAQDWAVWINPRVSEHPDRPGLLPVTLKLDRFSCHNADEDDWWSNGDEPYLFVVGLIADGSGVRLQDLSNPQVRVFSAPRTHGNLNRSGVDKNDSFSIPADTGTFEKAVQPIRPIGPLGSLLSMSLNKQICQVGLIVIAMEEDATATSTANKARKKLISELQIQVNALLADKIAQALGGANPQFSASEVSAMVAAIQRKVVDVATKDTLEKVNLFGMADPDDFIGSQVKLWSLKELDDALWQGDSFTLNFSKKGVRYSIQGSARLG